MPNCFQLLDKITGQAVPLNDVDTALCAHFGVQVDDNYYMSLYDYDRYSWYDSIGFKLACGETFAELREHYDTAENRQYRCRGLEVVNFLDKHYTTSAFCTRS